MNIITPLHTPTVGLSQLGFGTRSLSDERWKAEVSCLEWEDYDTNPSIPDSFLILRHGKLRVLLAAVLFHRREDGPNDFQIQIHDASQLGKALPLFYSTRNEAKQALETVYEL